MNKKHLKKPKTYEKTKNREDLAFKAMNNQENYH